MVGVQFPIRFEKMSPQLTSKTRSNVEDLSVWFRQEFVEDGVERFWIAATRTVVVFDGSNEIPEVLNLQMFFSHWVEALEDSDE